MKTQEKIEWFLSRTRYNLNGMEFEWAVTAQNMPGVTILTGWDKEGNKITVIVEVKHERD